MMLQITAFVTLLLCSDAFAATKITRAMLGALIMEARQSVVDLIISATSVTMRNTRRTINPGVAKKALSLEENCALNKVCVKHGNVIYATLEINSSLAIVNISRIARNPNAELVDCYELADAAEWYGGPQLRHQHWPIQHIDFDEEPYIHPDASYKHVRVRAYWWLSRKGMYIPMRRRANPTVPRPE